MRKQDMLNFMRVTITLVYMISIGACTSSTGFDDVDAVLDRGVENGRIPGVIAAVANSDGMVYQGIAGKRDLSGNVAMTFDTVMRIASMTKAVTSVAVMQLVEQGKIGLDSPIGQYLPHVAGVQVLEGFNADGEAILRAPKSAVTVRQLLTHTSGYVYEIWNTNQLQFVKLNPELSLLSGGDGFIAAPLAFDPGTNWEYGISTDMLGVLVEVTSGQSLDHYFREHIFEPLKMPDTYFNLPDDKLARLATAYSRSADGGLTEFPAPQQNAAFLSGGGGLASTANDYIRFLRALLNDGELDGARILNAETVQLMAQNHIGDLQAAKTVTSAMPGLSNDFDFMPGSVNKFGLGFLINSDPVPGGRSAGSLTWAGLFNTYFWIDREQDVAGVLMTQILPFYDDDVVRLMGEFEVAVYSSIK